MKSNKAKKSKNSNKSISFVTAMQNCAAKRKFRSEADAMRAAEIQMLTDMSLELKVYKCDACRYWHLTRA